MGAPAQIVGLNVGARTSAARSDEKWQIRYLAEDMWVSKALALCGAWQSTDTEKAKKE